MTPHRFHRPRALMLSGVSAMALMLAHPATAQTLSGLKGALGVPAAAPAGGAPQSAVVLPGAPVTPSQAAQRTAQSTTDLNSAVAALKNQLTLQANAHAAALAAASGVPNGLGAGALAPAAAISTDPSLWLNANAPTQATAGGQTTVTIQQTAPKALLTWDSFNVGQNTTVHFDQTAGSTASGTNGWVVLNRIVDPSGKPSQILGQIQAEGAVYLLDRNGILFGGSSQVNVNSLVASSLNLFSNDLAASNNRFLNGGIGDLNPTNFATNSILLTSSTPGAGDITIDQGASINIGTQGLGLVAAPNVTNRGQIAAPSGQIALVAGIGVSYDYNDTSFETGGPPQGTNANNLTFLRFANYGKLTDNTGKDITPVGSLDNEGLIFTPQGNITLLGGSIAQNGAAIATTSVSRPGSVVITSLYEVGVNAGSLSPADETSQTFYTGAISFGSNALTAVMPDAGGATIASDPTSLAPFQGGAGGGTFSSQLPIQGPGVISVIGQAIDFKGGSLTYAPGQAIDASVQVLADPRASVPAPAGSGRVLLETGAILDVAGIADTQLAMASNELTVKLAGNELADDPLQQGGALFGTTITVDMRDQGVNAETGEAWVGTPLANLASYENLVQRSINQLLVNGGSVSISGNEFVGETGSTINLAGGYLHYLGGNVVTTRLLDASGHAVPIGQADPNDVFVGVAGQSVVTHGRWGVTETYSNSLLDGSFGTFEPDDIQGGNAGRLGISVNGIAFNPNPGAALALTANSGAIVLQSNLLAGTVTGVRQAESGALPTDGGFAVESNLPVEITQSGGAAAGLLPAGFDPNTPLLAAPGSVYAAGDVFSAQLLNDAGFANINFTAGGPSAGAPYKAITEDAGATLSVQPGGAITLVGDNITINGALTARSGSISITGSSNSGFGVSSVSSVPGDITVGSAAVLDVSGFFVDDRQLPLAQQGLPVKVNAGSISLTTTFGSSAGEVVPGLVTPASATDLTGNITLAAGSLLNLQGGGHVLATGQLQADGNGVPLGSGGNLTLSTYTGLRTVQADSAILGPDGLPVRGVITADGSIDALGFNGGGTLTLQQIGFQIGGDRTKALAGWTYFDPAFWGSLGFGSFTLNAITGVDVPDDAIVHLQHSNLLPSETPAGVPVGANAAAISTPGILNGTQLSPTNLTVAAGQELFESSLETSIGDDSATIGAGAQLLGDPGATISISSYGSTSVLGTIRAPGGSISLAVPSSQGGVGPNDVLYLGPQSLLDVSGTVVLNPLAAPVHAAAGFVTPQTGKIYAGGTINLTDNVTAMVVAPGALLDVAGASGTFDVPQLVAGGVFGGDETVLSRQSQWSNGGTVNIAGNTGLLFAGTLEGQGGAPQASGATLSITGTSAVSLVSSVANLVLVQDAAQAIKDEGASFDFSTFNPTFKNSLADKVQFSAAVAPGVLLFGADKLDGSGFANLVLNDYSNVVVYSGKVALTLSNSVIIDTDGIVASKAGVFNFGFNAPSFPTGQLNPTGGASLTVNAPYIALNGQSQGGVLLRDLPAADASLTFNAQQIDVSAYTYLQNIGLATFNATGDIRLLPAQIIGGNFLTGYLTSAGDFAFNAADIYPATDTAFIIQSTGVNGSIRFGYPQGGGPSSQTPLSAGGALVASAANVVQDGELQAPFGQIILGVDGDDTLNSFSRTSLASVATQSVTLGAGSITSVSAHGAVIPFGTTVDQTTWNYDPAAANPTWFGASTANQVTPTPLIATPQGVVSIHGQSVAFENGSVVDVSGGGDLQAQEWIPGTGGTRDVLSQFNTTFAASSAGTQTPLFSDARQIFAIVPGFNSATAPYDATLAQTGLPVGEKIFLSGGPGLAAGWYTLLPAKYATQPGAFRVVVNSGVVNPLSSSTVVLPDGTLDMTGYIGNGFDGSHPSSLSQFMVQPASTWERYSQYAITSANSFFPTYASLNGLAAPDVPNDAGRLVLSATTGLAIDGKLLGTPGQGGLGGEVDISSQFLEIVGNGQTVDPGYLGISATALDNLGAASLLIGGTRAATADGVVITPTANGVIVADDAADPLTGEQILLVTTPQFQTSTVQIDNEGHTATIQVPVAGTGLVTIRDGSVVQATGSGSDVGGQTLIMGSTLSGLPTLPTSPVASAVNAQGTNLTALTIQNYYTALDATLGTLIDASTGAADSVRLPTVAQISPGAIAVQDNLGPNPNFTITLPSLLGVASGTKAIIETGAQVLGGNTLLLASTGDVNLQSGASISAKTISATSSAITFVGQGAAGTAPTSGFVIDTGLVSQLEQASNLNLQSYGAITFQGDVSFAMAAPSGSLTLDANTLAGGGGQVSISASTVMLENSSNAGGPAPAGAAGSLSVVANQLILGQGAKTIGGFGSATFTGSQFIVGQGSGGTDFGAMPVTLQTPTLIAGTLSDQTLTTTGALAVVSTGSTAPMTSNGLGGAVTLQGGSVLVAAPIQAQAGNITLKSSAGDVTITGAGALIAHGMAETFGGTTEYASGGAIQLSAAQGTVTIQPGAVVDFAGAANGGDGGSLAITTTGSTTPVSFGGTLLGATAPGAAGSTFSLNSAGAADIDSLAKLLTSAGVTGGIAVQTGQGDLILTGNLTAGEVALIANGGMVKVGGVIDASGSAGGEIELFGTSGVDVEGSLLARSSDPSQLGGSIEIGVSGNFDPATGTYNAVYGYENLASSGAITVGSNAVIDVSGGVKGALSGGTVLLRAPILADGSVDVVLSPSAVFKGARSVGLEAYATWSTADATTGAKHFDGIVDPSGWYDATGTLLAGSFVDSGGNVQAAWSGSSLTNDDGTTNSLSYYLANYFFQPNAADPDHETFYGFVNGDATAAAPGTLLGFVQAPGVAPVANSGGIANFQIIPGIVLANPISAGVNNGDIKVLTNWNVGAEDVNGNPLFRFNGIAPHITFRAGRDVQIDASITDGFHQLTPIGAPASPPPAGGFDFVSFNSLAANFIGCCTGQTIVDFGISLNGLAVDPAITEELPPASPSALGLADGDALNGYYGAYTAYDNVYENTYLFGGSGSLFSFLIDPFGVGGVTPPASVTNLLATANAAYGSISTYGAYLTAYQNYFAAWGSWSSDLPFGTTISYVPPMALPPPIASLAPPVPPVPTPTNAPNVITSATNSAAIAGMSLAAEASSSSYRIVAGADMQSANPLAVNAAASGNVTLDGHNDVGLQAHSNALIAVPTIVRTGTGSIDIAASGNFELLDQIAPGVVYTAGTTPTASSQGSMLALSGGAFNVTDGAGTRASSHGVSTILTDAINPDNAGNLTLDVGGDIIGFQNVIDTLASQPVVLGLPLASGLASDPGGFLGQFWMPWLLTNPANPNVPWYVNFGSFDQGLMSIGGNVTVKAGGNIRDLGVSLPTTGFLDSSNTLHLTGGGTLKVTAGGSIYSGDFYVGQGTGSIRAGGAITSDFNYVDGTGNSNPVETVLAVQYANIDVQARQSANIGGVYDPTYLWASNSTFPNTSPVMYYASSVGSNPIGPVNLVPFITSMSTNSGVSIQSVGGDVSFNSLTVQGEVFALGQVTSNGTIMSLLLPASLNLAAIDGGVTIGYGGGLYPSATGSLSIVADQSINLKFPVGPNGASPFNTVGNVLGNTLGKLDDMVGTGILPTASNPELIDGSLLTPVQARDPSLVADGASGTVLIYSQTGSLIDGSVLNKQTVGQLSLIPNAPTQINVALDILDLPFFGENFNADDITSIIAGRDIRYNPFGNGQAAAIEIAGPGTLDVEAGRNLNFQTQRTIGSPETGIRTIGNSIDASANAVGQVLATSEPTGFNFLPRQFGNPFLPHGGASVNVLFGTGPGMDQSAFISKYIDPASAVTAAPFGQATLVSFVDQYEDGLGNAAAAPTTAEQAWVIFQTLPANQQQLLVQKVFDQVLDATGKDYNDPSSPFFHQYARGYEAINTLFPASLGYTQNGLDGGTNGANQLIATGNFDMRGSTLQSQQGGDISIFGPGGRILVGSSTASPAINPASEGILTLENGDIDIFTDQDVLVAQSRVMTEQGGSILMWTSNGNLDAGKGVKTSVSAPPPEYACDLDFVCIADIKGEVSGAGIATLQSLPGVPTGDADLVAPRGTVDAGAAGIRVSGNLNIAALQVLNAFNIQVQGQTFGLPPKPSTNLVLATADAASKEAIKVLQDMNNQSRHQAVDSIVSVEVVGFGGNGEEPTECIPSAAASCAAAHH
jgi:filamentous hemagglutinin family protein